MIGQRIRAARLERGWTQHQFADLLGTDSMVVSRWERGQQEPNGPMTVRLIELLGCDVVIGTKEQK